MQLRERFFDFSRAENSRHFAPRADAVNLSFSAEVERDFELNFENFALRGRRNFVEKRFVQADFADIRARERAQKFF